ncbi:unnamed protein product, partial [Didymodactylos carnosus]
VPVHEVNEDDTVTLTVDRPKGKDVAVILLKDGERLEQNDHINRIANDIKHTFEMNE